MVPLLYRRTLLFIQELSTIIIIFPIFECKTWGTGKLSQLNQVSAKSPNVTENGKE